MIQRFSRHLADYYERHGVEGVEIRARVPTSLNGRRFQLLVDPAVDLAAQPRSLAPVDWILPLTPPRYR
jgi:hypothetical protein